MNSITLFDSFEKKLVQISPNTTVKKGVLKLYSCGPTVYNYMHIGNLRATWLPDAISKVAKMSGYEVEWVQNITDVGHLVDDSDDGEDKMEKGAKRENKTVSQIVDFYTDDFKKQCQALNINLPSGHFQPKASEYIEEQMILALELLADGKAYLLDDGIYYDSSRNKGKVESGKTDNELELIIQKIKDLQTKNRSKPIIVAVDGRSGSGKSTLAKILEQSISSSVRLNLDAYTLRSGDFFSDEHIQKGFEIDFENTIYLIDEIKKEIQKFSNKKVIILEGAFSFKNLEDINFDLKIFVDLDKELAANRLNKRELEERTEIDPEIIRLSTRKWQEAEDRYFLNFNPKDKVDLVVSTENYEYEIIGKHTNYTGRDIVNTTKNPEDFALWKFVEENALQKWKFNEIEETEKLIIKLYKQDSGTPTNLPNRWGCPGWHSECVAMICSILGTDRFIENQNFDYQHGLSLTKSVIDIHTGGEDHIDIHHKNERLQSDSLGLKLSNAWVHNKFVLVDDKKMAKAVGNVFMVTGDYEKTGFYSLTRPPLDVQTRLEKKYKTTGFDPLSYRLMLLEHHYTEQINFTWEKLEQSQNRLWNIRKEMAKVASFARLNGVKEQIEDKQIQVLLGYLTDNLGIPKFIEKYQTFLLDVTTEISKNQTLNPKNLGALNYFEKEFLNLNLNPDIGMEIFELAEKRQQAKEQKDYPKSDQIRNEILALGFQIDDYNWGFGLWAKS